jgi:hypothetical protein
LVQNRVIKFGLGSLRSFFLDDIKPTKAGNSPLWALNELDRQNKHRALPIVIAAAAAPLPEWTSARDNWVIVEPGCESATPLPRAFIFEQDQKFDRTLYVRLGKTPVFEGEALVPVLVHLHHATAQILAKIRVAYIAAYGPLPDLN